MDQTVRFQETLRRLAIFDEGFAESGLGPSLAETSVLDAKTVALLQVAVSVAIGSSAVCLEWSAARALAAGATKDEIADVLLAIAPVAGLGRVVSAVPDVATALEYDIDTLTAAFHPGRADASVLVLNALLGVGTTLAPVFVAIFVGLGFWWGLPVMSSVLLLALIALSAGLPLRVGAPGGHRVAAPRRSRRCSGCSPPSRSCMAFARR
jgi:alkylhydroperoxidase/carboxymuconolactone decarboxylase family protein YurZ